MRLGIFLPTYKRPDRLQEVASNIERATKGKYKLYFGCEPEDIASIEGARATGHEVVINTGTQGYSDTIQTIYEQSREAVIFHANDDFEFLDEWDVAPMNFLKTHPKIMVLGADDGTGNPSYSTISFIRRKYIEKVSGVIDMPKRVFYPYRHNYQDTEFTRTAQARDVWNKIEGPCIKHHRLPLDETYRKNNATSAEDAHTFESRKHLWENIDKEDNVMWGKKPTSKKKPITEPVEDSRPAVKDTEQSSMASRALDSISMALEVIALIKEENPEMIEATQAVEALTEARNRAGQVEGLLRSQK